jgi:hypothetical protein
MEPASPSAGPAPLPPRMVRPVRLALYGLLIAVVAVTFAGVPGVEDAVREGRQSPVALMVAPALLVVFIVLFAAYRFSLARARRYHAGKAFVQIGVMVLFLTLLLPSSIAKYQAATASKPVELMRPLLSVDPEQRAMAAELVRHRDRDDALRYVPRIVALLDDVSPEVRRQARATLIALAGEDAGGEGADARDRWRRYWKEHGAPLR